MWTNEWCRFRSRLLSNLSPHWPQTWQFSTSWARFILKISFGLQSNRLSLPWTFTICVFIFPPSAKQALQIEHLYSFFPSKIIEVSHLYLLKEQPIYFSPINWKLHNVSCSSVHYIFTSIIDDVTLDGQPNNWEVPFFQTTDKSNDF